ETRALQYAIPANCLLIGALSLLIPAGPLSAAMMLDAFLLAMAAIGITGHAAVLIVPNMAIKILLLLIMLFIGCVSIDTFHAHYIKESVGIIGEAEKSHSAIFRLFFCAWYKIAFGSHDGVVKDVDKLPPSYAYCISHSTPTMYVSADELPSYEEAVRRSSDQKPSSLSRPLPRSAQLPCCSTSKPPPTTTASSSNRHNPRLMKSETFRYVRPASSSQAGRTT
ncbi:hypothetical protein GCK32_018013, partial [Trichostrongylus colubriformis]